MGPVRRFGVKIQNRHAKQKLRHVGAIAQQVPRRVRWTARLAGQMGFQTRTELNKRVLKIGSGSEIVPKSGFNRYGVVKSSYVMLQGSVPGPKKRLVILRNAIRPQKVKAIVPDIREIA
jgi:large subunit ribosomal protein L3